jgi:hypothetical protein
VTDEYIKLIFGGSLFVGLAALLTVFATRKRDQSTDLSQRFKDNLELRKFVKEEAELVAEPLQKAIKELQDRELNTKTIIVGFLQRLFFWEEKGRPGPLPRLSDAQFTQLGIDIAVLLDDTTPHDEVSAAAQAAHQNGHPA